MEVIFLNNKYTKWYYNIINSAKNRSINSSILHSHHIIPESFFKDRNRKGRVGWLSGDPDAIDNLILLTPKEHLLCHLLLKKMTVGEAKYKADKSALWMVETYKKKNPEIKITTRLYQQLLEDGKNARKGQQIWNDGTKDTMSHKCPGSGWTKGSIHTGSKKCSLKGKKSYHNGIITKFFDQDPGEGWTRGTLQEPVKSNLGKTWWNNGITEISTSKFPGSEWRKGRLKAKFKGTTTNKKAYNNGKITKYFNDPPGSEWQPGGMPRKKR